MIKNLKNSFITLAKVACFQNGGSSLTGGEKGILTTDTESPRC